MITKEDVERVFGTYVEPDDETIFLEMCDDFCVQVLLEMERQNLTMTELAKRMGVAQSTLSKQLSGEQNLTAKTMAKMARALGCGIEAPKLVHLASRQCFAADSIDSSEDTSVEFESVAEKTEPLYEMNLFDGLEVKSTKRMSENSELRTWDFPDCSSEQYTVEGLVDLPNNAEMMVQGEAA